MGHDSDTIVIGGGLIGLATAWELVSRGEAVTVIEAREDVALESSYANGAILSASMPDPWNGPGVHRHLLASLFNPYSPMKLRVRAIPGLFVWGLKFLKASSASHYWMATRASYRLAAFSVAATRALRESLGLEYEAETVGTMKVFREQDTMARQIELAEALVDLGLHFELLDSAGTVAAEPQLAPIADSISGALRFPDDESGDARLFCQAIGTHIIEHGGIIKTGERASQLLIGKDRISGIEVDGERIAASRVVVAAGNGTKTLLAPIGLPLPIAPAKGYSVTVYRNGLTDWPRLPIVDDVMHAALVPVGDRLRMAGTAEFTGLNKRMDPARIDNLFNLLEALYPRIYENIDREGAEPWTGFRPMSADGLPFIGPTPIGGLYVNAGHGHLGWTLAAGSATLLVDLIQNKSPCINPAPYDPRR